MPATGRQRSLIIPREHGAWGILLIPLFTGACVGLLTGGDPRPLLPLTIAALALFWLRTPVESWIGSAPIRARTAAELRLVRAAVAALSLVSTSALTWLFSNWQNRDLIWIGCAAAAAFVLQGVLKQVWRPARTAAQMIGSAGLTSTAPAAWYVVTGRIDATAWALWAANLLFAINQIHFVQLRIHAAQVKTRTQKLSMGRGFLIGQLIEVALLVAGCIAHLFSWYAALAFAPILYRGFAWFAADAGPLAVHSLGKSELAYACVFGVLLVVGPAYYYRICPRKPPPSLKSISSPP